MEIIIESPHFTVNDMLQEYVTRKVNKLEHLNERIIKSEVLLKLDKSDTEDNKICEVILHAPRKNFFAVSKSSTFEDAVSATMHSLEKQLRKQKTKFEKTNKKIEMEDISEGESE